MAYLTMFIAFLAIFQQTVLTTAFPLDARNDRSDVCRTGIYGQLVPLMQPYQPVQAFCSRELPPQCTVSHDGRDKRSYSETTMSTGSSVASKATVTRSGNARESAFSMIVKEGGDLIRTICSCIQSHTVGRE